MQRVQLLSILLAVAVAALAAGAPPARAADYRVVQCAHAPHDFIPFSESPGMYVEDKCASIAALSVRASLGAFVATEHDVMWLARAPDGTSFSSWEAAFQGGANGNAGFLPYAVACADVHCTVPIQYIVLGLENWGSPVFRRWAGTGALRLQFGLVCTFGAPGGCRVPAHPPGADMLSPEMTLTDHHRPGAPAVTGGSLPSSAWVSGRAAHSVAFAAADRGGGVDRVVATASTGASWTYTAPCARGHGAYTRLTPCPLSLSATLPIDVGALADGRHRLSLTTVDAAGQAAASGPYELNVDNGAPAAPAGLAVVGGDGWRAADGFRVRWSNPPQAHAPIAAARWRLCASARDCRSGRVAANGVIGLDDLVVGRSGAHELRVWLEDAAGNHDPGHAAGPLRLRLDGEPPRPAFEDRDPARPLALAVRVADDVSGLADGSIEMRREGSDSWRVLPTTVGGGRLTATIDDEALPAGAYELRARAVDRAGNEATTDRTLGGARMAVRLPVRVLTKLRAGRRTTRVRRVRVRRAGRRRFVRRRVVALDARPTARAGAAVPIVAVLRSRDGRPLADVEVLVQAPSAAGAFQTLATLRTDAAGRVRYRARPRRNQTLRLRYPGSPHVRGATAAVRIGVRAASSIRVSERSVRNGESVVLRGRVRTRPLPARGKLVEVQAFFRDRWRTFSTVRSNRRGRWLLPYTFGGTVGTVRYRFRARLPAEGGYPFATGSSPPAWVTVHGL